MGTKQDDLETNLRGTALEGLVFDRARKWFYRAVRNYVANELHMGREAIEEIVERVVTKAFVGWLHQNWEQSWMRNLFAKTVRETAARVIRDDLVGRLEFEVTIGKTPEERLAALFPKKDAQP